MKKIALTGGMGTGKTTVIWMFQEMGAEIVNADEISHELLKPKTIVWKILYEHYGDRILKEGNEVDRRILADIIFNDDAERKYVERAIHPRVHEELSKIAAHLEHDEKPYMLVEVPLLFETGWEKEFDAVVVVRCDPEQQIARCMDKFELTREEALHRIGIQRPLDAKVAKADFVIDNVGSLDETQVQVQRLYRLFEKGEFKSK